MLDLAAGAGWTALTFAPRITRVDVTDLTPQMLAAAQKLNRTRRHDRRPARSFTCQRQSARR